ncbi:S9 family peptidase [Nocardioides marmoraquaticus]
MRPDDLDLLSACGRPSLTPDGAVAVTTVTRPDLASDAYVGGLWAVPTDGSAPWRLTAGERDSAPAVSPDGTRVVFLRAGEGKAPQLHVTPLRGGEPVAVTDADAHPLGAGAPAWSPDGTRLAYAARVAEAGRYGTEDDEGRSPEPSAEHARLVTTFRYRTDDLGYTRDRRRHVFVVAVPRDVAPGVVAPKRAEPTQLTDGDQDDTDPVWSPDGRSLLFVSARHDTREFDLRVGVSRASVDGGSVETVLDEPHLDLGPVAFLPDGRLVVGAREVGEGTDFVGRPTRLGVADGGSVELLTDEEHDLDIGSAADLVVAGDRVVVRELHRGTVRLLSVPLDGSAPEVLLPGEVVVAGHAVAGETVVVAAATPVRRADLAVVTDQSPRWLTKVSAGLSESGVRPLETRVVHGSDGYEVQGWVVLPDPGRFDGPHPVLLNIHGGPYSQYDVAVFDEAQVYAGAGYAVVMCNPRGSSGYGAHHGRVIRGAMGSVDADDVLTFLDGVLADDSLPLDSDRVGVMGGSYGGYMTATLTTRTDRFAAAIVERGYLDGHSFVGSSDIGWFFPGEYSGDRDGIVAQSPMTHVDRVTTPTLVIHSEEDWRCPVEQGQRWFTELKLRGVEAELLLFPGEGHELSRSGRPRHRRQRFDHILRWWTTHLPV